MKYKSKCEADAIFESFNCELDGSYDIQGLTGLLPLSDSELGGVFPLSDVMCREILFWVDVI